MATQSKNNSSLESNEKIKKAADMDGAACLDTVQEIKKAIEAILYAAGYPVSYEKLSDVIGLAPNNLKQIISQMSEEYEKRGIMLLLYPETCQLATKEEYAPYIREALGIRRGGNLSASSLEVLAVVAYNQPVTRAFIDSVRGVDSSYAVTSLLDKGLIEACGRLDAPGRPMLYITTDKFLRVFGLASLSELPETEALSTAGIQMRMGDEVLEGADEDAQEDADESNDDENTAADDVENTNA